ncbi:DUF885 family protein [Rheinheimera sp.]|uniref:DUF885 domain-containing protein n=1 Tax=Rheinheimera sp. TaxID=1869214 RepID=UPI0027BAB5F4|nr:DUF885 domain-containing protein [Rheinheimera sp.]
MQLTKSTLALAVTLALLGACSPAEQPANNQAATQPSAEQSAQKDQTAATQTESEKLNAFFEEAFMAQIQLSPTSMTGLGIKQDYDKWDAFTDEQEDKELALTKAQLEKLKTFNVDALDAQSKLSYQLFKQQLEDNIADDKWRLYNYPVNQMYGYHSMVPSLLINQHSIDNEADAKAYIARLNGILPLFQQVTVQLDKRAELGIIPPKFVFPHAISASKNVITGAPFGEGADSTLLEDFRGKVNKLSIDDAAKQLLLKEAEVALVSSVKPAYEHLINHLTALETKAGTDDGVWRFKDGAEFYNNALKRTTTTNMTADQIHELGLAEVARIHAEMNAIMQKVGFKGDLQAFFAFMREDAQFYYPDNAEGKAAYLAEATRVIDVMKGKLDELFLVKPKADMVVKAVEPFREQSAGKAFYEQPSMDGSRPGIYYANLYRMKGMPKYELEALAYHEGIPGHHMQIAISQELENVPKFRKFGGYTAYIEGWGLYTELLPKEIGMYQDPYSDFGRLAMELWRACRLVVDTGIHAKKWTRDEAIAYLAKNTPNAASEQVNAIERYIVMPSQATAYKIGMIKIVQLREKAKTELGDKFDIRDFHDVVLKNGAVPLDVLEMLVDDYIKAKKA